MSNGKWTPGPWYATQEENESYRVSQQPDGGTFWVAEVYGGLMGDEEEANARLIAAAPDLCEALWAILYADQDNHISDELYERARAAIAKATGEES